MALTPLRVQRVTYAMRATVTRRPGTAFKTALTWDEIFEG
jgi:hypothetical protein